MATTNERTPVSNMIREASLYIEQAGNNVDSDVDICLEKVRKAKTILDIAIGYMEDVLGVDEEDD